MPLSKEANRERMRRKRAGLAPVAPAHRAPVHSARGKSNSMHPDSAPVHRVTPRDNKQHEPVFGLWPPEQWEAGRRAGVKLRSGGRVIEHDADASGHAARTDHEAKHPRRPEDAEGTRPAPPVGLVRRFCPEITRHKRPLRRLWTPPATSRLATARLRLSLGLICGLIREPAA
jgi:hypothetical protein